MSELSPVPTHTTLASEGATATAPTEVIPAESVTGSQVVPLLLVRHTPPVRAPANMVWRWALAGVSGTAREVTHAPVRHGPRLRYWNAFRTSARWDRPRRRKAAERECTQQQFGHQC